MGHARPLGSDASSFEAPAYELLDESDSDAVPDAGYADLHGRRPARLQAPDGASYRLQSGLVSHACVASLFGANRRVVEVPSCGHLQSCEFSTDLARDELFGP